MRQFTMKWITRTGITAAAALTMAAGGLAGGAALAAPAPHTAAVLHGTFPLRLKPIGHTRSGKAIYVSPDAPTGLSPSAIESAYSLSPTATSGSGQIIALIEAYGFSSALSNLNTFSKQYGLPVLSACSSLSQSGPCFDQVYPQGSAPPNNGDSDTEQALDMEWAHAMAPDAKIMLVDATNFNTVYSGVVDANNLGATEESMSFGTGNSDLPGTDGDFSHAGTIYLASSGDSGHGNSYPALAPGVTAVGGTTLNGCGGTSCSGFRSETAWNGSGGGHASKEAIPSYQASYTGPVSGAATISSLTGSHRGMPDVSFEANPSTGVSIYDGGWITVGGTSVGAPSWAGILAAGASAGMTALQGNAAIYSGGYKTNLRDITSGSNGSCGTNCKAGVGYDLVTGLGSPIDYP
jgi:subtilase family serine protease